MRVVGVVFLFITCLVYADNSSPVVLESPNVSIYNSKAIANGANFFAKNCLACHSMKLLRHDKVANDAGITLDNMPNIASTAWSMRPPPDLSVIARVRSTNWLYTYLHSFYVDESVALGSNNLLMHNTSMPNVFLALQGRQVLQLARNKWSGTEHYYQLLHLDLRGELTPHQFDMDIKDLVTFLLYAADPHAVEREYLGIKVVLFVVLLAFFAILLTKSYWRLIKK